MNLVFPDLHCRLDLVRPIYESLKDSVDKIIFLGDILDNPKETEQDTINTLKWFSELLYQDHEGKIIFTLGNHDNYVEFGLREMFCSRNTEFRRQKWQEYMPKNRGKLCYWDGYWLYSHAGIHPDYFTTVEALERECETSIQAAREGAMTRLFTPGWCRGGWGKNGGINWIDWDWGFRPIPGLNQIVGHTADEEPKIQTGENSFNLCLDTQSRHYAITDKNKVFIYDHLGKPFKFSSDVQNHIYNKHNK